MIREALIEDLPGLETIAGQFYASSDHLHKFEIDKFAETWLPLLKSGIGVIFLLFEGSELAGTIGGVKHRDLYSESMIATEFFWFVRPESRGSGVRLYRAFEQWAELKGCNQIRMALLKDLMPAKLDSLYRRLGFHPTEALYAKDLKCV